ncbi:chromodomain-helicase-DNA-binding protein 2-like [Dendroctonus ponderosae]|uniref:chromodomain-helicase-DNA-binding protein 2-like n=1 Tax=Dendroctonus ponderosae TaxID=77166 RepID=UPI0020358581|nr:chromodomain-helicase-DNA-binding protein 2-like [Dendroctonus ponderosae]KAH1012982.1 hypothetical protein HUJ05_012041 [Dendroctonus ponderosae]
MAQSTLAFVVFCCCFRVFVCVEQNQNSFAINPQADYFNPFTESGIAESQQSASVVPRPNVISVQSDIFRNSFRNLIKPTVRSIGKYSGNAQQLNAQLWQPNSFLADFAKMSEQAAQHQLARRNEFANTPRRMDISVEPQKLSDFKSVTPQLENPIGIQNQPLIPFTPRTNTYIPNMLPYKKLNAQPSYTSDQIVRPSFVQVHPSSEHDDHVLAQSADWQTHADPSVHSGSKLKSNGNDHHDGHYRSHGESDEEDYNSSHHDSKGNHKKYHDHDDKAYHREKGGHDDHHHDDGAHYKKQHEASQSHKAAKFGEKKGHKRGHKTKGYHNKFHRDEYHREHRFYDDYHKEGFHKKHGQGHSHYKNKKGAFKKGRNHNSSHSSDKKGKKGYSKKGKLNDEHEGFDVESGHRKYHRHHKNHQSKQGNTNGKKYGYNRKH